MINGNMIGIGSAPLKTVIIEDENGNQHTGVVTGSEVVFTATPADVRVNKTFVSDGGIQIGENTITYRTAQGAYMVFAGEEFIITTLVDHNQYDYTQLQCIIAPFDGDLNASVAADKIVLHNSVYPVNSYDALSVVSKDIDNKAINLNIVNDTEYDYVIHYFTYREEA